MRLDPHFGMYPEDAFKHCGDRRIRLHGGGGGLISGIGGAIGGTLGGVGSIVGGTLSGVGNAIGSMTQGMGGVLGQVVNLPGKVLNSTVHVIEDLPKTVEKLATTTVKTIKDAPKTIVTTINNTIAAAQKNPLDAAVLIATAVYAPEYLPAANAAIAVEHGASPAEAAKVAATTFVAQQAISATGVGNATASAGVDAANYAQVALDMSPTTAAYIQSIVPASLNASIVSGVNAVIRGKPIGEAMVQGLATGAINGAASAYVNDLAQSGALDIDPKYQKIIAGSLGVYANAALRGGTPEQIAQAATIYALNAIISGGGSTAVKQASADYQNMRDTSAKAEAAMADLEAQRNTLTANPDYQTKLDTYNQSVTDYNEQVSQWSQSVQPQLDKYKDAYDTNMIQYRAAESRYNDTTLSVDERNAAAQKMDQYATTANDAAQSWNDVYNANKAQIDSITSKQNELQTQKSSIDEMAKPLNDSLTAYQKAKEDVTKAQETLKVSDEALTKQIASTATRNVAIDAINSGAVKATSTENGITTFENGVSVDQNGKFYQDGQEIFTDAAGIKQNNLTYTGTDGNQYQFNQDAGRLTSPTDIQAIVKRDYGIDITPEEAAKISGGLYGKEDAAAVKELATEKIDEQVKNDLHMTLTDQQKADFLAKGAGTGDAVAEYIDKNSVSADEAKQFLRETLGREPTDTEVAQFSGPKQEDLALTADNAYKNQLYSSMLDLFTKSQDQQLINSSDVAKYAALSPVNQSIATDASQAYLDGSMSWEEASAKINAAVEKDINSGYLKPLDNGKYVAPDGTEYVKNSDTGMWDAANVGVTGGQASGNNDEILMQDFVKALFDPHTVAGVRSENAANKSTADQTGGAGVGTSSDLSATTTNLISGTDTGEGTGVGSGTGTGANNGSPLRDEGEVVITSTRLPSEGVAPSSPVEDIAPISPVTGVAPTSAPSVYAYSSPGKAGTAGSSWGSITPFAVPANAGDETAAKISSLKPSYLTSSDIESKFESPLARFQKVASNQTYNENQYAPQQPQTTDLVQHPFTPTPKEPVMSAPYYNYGVIDSINQILNPVDYQRQNTTQLAASGGLITPLMAAGGATGTRHGRYAGGGLSTPTVLHSGKERVDFRHGDAVTGAGDGQSDDIPAMLADGEFVFPADVVAAIGNGSTKAGSDKLYDMMHGIRSHVRSAKPHDLPPEVKSPLDFLKTKPSKARR